MSRQFPAEEVRHARVRSETHAPVRANRGCGLDAAGWNAIGGGRAGDNGSPGPELRLLLRLGAAPAESRVSDQGLRQHGPRSDEGKARRVPNDLAACHTAQIGDYVIEGHVPTVALKRFLTDKPSAIGLAVPGMPVGSPGMEGGSAEPYDVVMVGPAGRRTYMRFVGDRAL